MRPVERNDLSQRLIHDDVCTKASKEAIKRIPALLLLASDYLSNE